MADGRKTVLLTSLLGIALAVAALCAGSASAAVWTISGKTLAELGLKEESAASSAAFFAIEVPKISLKVECEVEKGSGKIISPSTDETTMELSKCKVGASKVCTVGEPVVIKAKTELIKKAGIVYDVLGAKEAELGTLKIKGEECALASELKLKGTTAGQLGPGEEVKAPLIFSKAVAEAAGTSLLAGAGASPTFFTGTSNRTLSGAKTGAKWGVCVLCGVFAFAAEEGYGAGNPAEPNVIRSFEGNQINLATGNLVQAQTDLTTGGRGPGLELTRYYNSRLAASAKSAGAFGFGWTSTYSANLVVNEAAETVTVRNDNGSTALFYLVEGKYQAAPWIQAKLAKEGTNYVYTLPNQLKLTFTSTGQLSKETDRHGNAVTLAYNAKSHLETATDAAGRKLTFTYNAGGQVESVKDPMGHLAKYTYESSNLATVTLPEEKLRWKFAYDASHQITGLTDGRSHTTTFEYDASQRVKLEKDALERQRTVEYPSGTETKVTEPNTSATVETFNSAGEPTAITRASGTAIAAKTTSEYDSSFNLKAITEPNTHTTKYGYDAEGNRTSETDANNNETKWTYNSTHDVSTVTTPKGETTTITRNTAGDPESIKRPAPGATTQEETFKYAANGDLESETDPLKHTTTIEYDGNGNRKALTDPAGDKTTWTNDQDGLPIAEVSPRGNEEGAKASEFETKTERDAQERLIKITDPLGHETKYKYDADGNLEVLTNPNAHATTYVYDAADQRTEVKAANGNTIKTAYDSMGKVKSRTDGNAHTIKYERNLLEQISEEIDPLERKTIRTYDAAGNLKELKDAEGRTTTYTYDPGDRLKEVKYSEEATKPVSYEYGKDDEVTVMKDATGTTTKTYDELDRLTEVKNGNVEVVKYEYDLGDEITKITYPNAKSITRGFDAAGRLEKVTDWLSKETKFSYNRDSLVKATTFPTASTNKDEYEYNTADQLTKTSMLKSAETLASISYTRDNTGQLKTATQKGLPGAEKAEYGYDEKERMTSGAGSAFEYDAANNVTKVAATTYSYDAANQLKEGGGIKYTFTYDGNGLRASETINGTTTHMAWDTAAALPLLLFDGTNYYLYGPDGLPFEQISSETATYLHHDQQGSTRLLTNASGETKGSYTYKSYGITEAHTGTSSTPLGYDGQYTNSDTGLIYLRKRVFDPTDPAQFMSRDPLEAETGEAYGYARGNPVNAGDPSGEQVATPRPPTNARPPATPGNFNWSGTDFFTNPGVGSYTWSATAWRNGAESGRTWRAWGRDIYWGDFVWSEDEITINGERTWSLTIISSLRPPVTRSSDNFRFP